MEVIRDVLADNGSGFGFSPMLWRFDQLNGANWSELALRDAANADIVVLASTESGGLPASLEHWVSALLGRVDGRPVTIVAVFGSTEAWTISIEKPISVRAAPIKDPRPASRTAVAASAAYAA